MKWCFWRREATPVIAEQVIVKRIESFMGFTLGQIVQHKIDAVRVVIVEFDTITGHGLMAYSSKPGDECWFSLYEVEPSPAHPSAGVPDA